MRRVLCAAIIAMLLLASALAETMPVLPTLEPVQPLRSARVRAVGDLMVHAKQLEIARQADGSYDFYPQYALIRDSLANADYTIANLETTIGLYHNMDYSGFPLFNSPETLLDTIRDAGVDFLTLANNHMLDRYFEGMCATVDHVEAHGFDFAGANRTPEEKARNTVVEVNGIGIGFICCTEMTNGMEDFCDADAVSYGVNYIRDVDIDAQVRSLRGAGAEVIIAIPHWGEEYFRQPEARVVTWARRLIAGGVDVVLGSHPHMVQPVKYVTAEAADGTTRTGLVAYSLGNFISNMSKQYTDSGIILEFTIQERQDGGFEIVRPGVVPIYCWRQDERIQAVSSLKYFDERPAGMSDSRYARMKESYRELRSLLGDEIAMLPE